MGFSRDKVECPRSEKERWKNSEKDALSCDQKISTFFISEVLLYNMRPYISWCPCNVVIKIAMVHCEVSFTLAEMSRQTAF